MRSTSIALVAAAALAAAVPLAAGLTGAAADERAAAADGFVPVHTTPFRADSITSPADGVAYVVGTDSAEQLRLQRLTRTATGVDVSEVALPGDAKDWWRSYGQLASYGGRTYLASQQRGLFEVTPEGLQQMPLPKVPGRDGATVDANPSTVVADRPDSVWIVSAQYALPTHTFHWDGHSWSETTPRDFTPGAYSGPAYAKGGHFWQLGGRSMSQAVWASEWDGEKWSRAASWTFGGGGVRPIGRAMTIVSVGDRTYWGYTLPAWNQPDTAVRGSCQRTVGEETTECPAPAFAVNAAARLLDGRVVLGGADRTENSRTVEGGFAVVPRPGAEPETVPGDPGSSTLALAAPTVGETVWALTATVAPSGGDTTSVQVWDGGH